MSEQGISIEKWNTLNQAQKDRVLNSLSSGENKDARSIIDIYNSSKTRDGKVNNDELNKFFKEADVANSDKIRDGIVTADELRTQLGGNEKALNQLISVFNAEAQGAIVGELKLTGDSIPTPAPSVTPSPTSSDTPSVQPKKAGINEDGTVTVVNWSAGKAPEKGMKPNNCLWNITHNYMPEGMDFKEAMKAVMEANPQIYGDGAKKYNSESTRGSRTGTVQERWLYDNEPVHIPQDWIK